MAVSAGGEAVGSVSGGCVEGAVYELAREVNSTGKPVLQRYGISDDDAFAVGLTCGGIIDIYVERPAKSASRTWARWPARSRRASRWRSPRSSRDRARSAAGG